jgi:hypothetical protein
LSAIGFGIRAALNARLVRENRRAAARHQHGGNDTWIRLEGCLARLCQVIDLSRTGARLAVTSARSLPDTFTLILSKNSGGCRLARVKWRRGNEFGAEFINADSSVPRLPADAPRVNPTSASHLTVDARRSNSSPDARLIADASRAATPCKREGEKSENPISTRSVRTPAQQPHIGKPNGDLGSIGSDKAKSEADRQITSTSGRVDRPDQEKNNKNRMDLSRLQKKLGPKHVALIHALKDVDPESPHGRELASIIKSLDESCDSQRAIESINP